MQELLVLIHSVVLKPEDVGWSWLGDATGVYSVRSSYAGLMEDSSLVVGLSDDQVVIVGRLWRSLAPQKLIAFAW